VYTVSFTASNGDGDQCSGSVTVGVPHDPKWDAVNDGPLFDSTQPQGISSNRSDQPRFRGVGPESSADYLQA